MMFAIQSLKKIIHPYIKNIFLISYSGGLDSHVLLHAICELKKQIPELKLKAIHVNHHINIDSKAWAQHCQKTCDDLFIPLIIENVFVKKNPGDSLEENARKMRYDSIVKHMTNETILLTAHHQNDQAETFLLQALRGAGPKGLSAMPFLKKLKNGSLMRPLLSFSRDELKKYAIKNQLNWIEDESNQNIDFDRNFLRHDLFPILQKRKPGVFKAFSRCARLLSEHEKIISDIGKMDYENVREKNCECKKKCACPKNALNREKLLLLSDARQRLVLREWFLDNNLRAPNEKHLYRIQRSVINTAPSENTISIVDLKLM